MRTARTTGTLGLVLLAALAGAGVGRPAAGSCVARRPAQHFAAADAVFLGRAGRVSIKGKLAVQPFEVLQVLKGRPGRVFLRQRVAGVVPPNDRSYRPGEVALVFVSRGLVELCAGNHTLADHLPDLGVYLRLGAVGTEARATPDLATFAAAFKDVLQGYLHDRPRVPVSHAPLAGKSLRLGRSALPFVAGRQVGGVEITRAVRRGLVDLVSGRYPTEGYSFDVLLLRAGSGGPVVLDRWARENR